MASTGAGAWAKYYQGRGEQATTVKTTSTIYDAQGRPLGTQLAAGTPIVVLAMPEYDSKPRIRVKISGIEQIVRFKFDAIVKPGNKASSATSLKPQAFGVVTAAPIQLAAYKKKALDTLEERDDMDGELKSYLALLLEYWGSMPTPAKKSSIIKLYPQIKNQIPINDINKDFGEVLGPMAILKHGILAGTGHEKQINSTSGIFIPARPNEPLMDYKVGDVVVSAKSGTTTNTVKPGDVLGLLAKTAAMKRKYNTTAEYRVLEILDTNSTKTGPVEAVKYLLGNKFEVWVGNNVYFKSKKGKFTDIELMYECEKYLQAESKNGKLNYTKLFADAIKGTIVYVKFELDTTGVGKFESIVAADVLKSASGARPYLRTKNGYTRASDRMGIQI
jgi:hypothetical protein